MMDLVGRCPRFWANGFILSPPNKRKDDNVARMEKPRDLVGGWEASELKFEGEMGGGAGKGRGGGDNLRYHRQA